MSLATVVAYCHLRFHNRHRWHKPMPSSLCLGIASCTHTLFRLDYLPLTRHSFSHLMHVISNHCRIFSCQAIIVLLGEYAYNVIVFYYMRMSLVSVLAYFNVRFEQCCGSYMPMLSSYFITVFTIFYHHVYHILSSCLYIKS